MFVSFAWMVFKRLFVLTGYRYRCDRNQLECLPYYARLTATLTVVMPKFGGQLTDLLTDEFRYALPAALLRCRNSFSGPGLPFSSLPFSTLSSYRNLTALSHTQSLKCVLGDS
eukprot:COSAG05_NODE_3504_length_2024_cov_1.375065_3_plen_113_part_00